ncbi:putative metallopeptidase, family M24 [Phaeobacter piscinae]|uniref:Metallopeptidase, family M24 n=1 Tax=Phaeobacter piscinae TaxID=1580596 RepID=A0ABM6PGN7_9RHOB|nr:Xaa-Pro peptidase family protein [Phaeobacter piscinae]ATG36744.1 putative metallopeptidase, family M24 [Phaeobacter piscinae]AUQ87265.1 putative metallopeptidase, family M24 [Phaeobacter piscinae]AUR25148.1 putative metallopeptidase, family M24 [Phaeobacter piscinae]
MTTPPYADRLTRLRHRMTETATDLVVLGPSSHMMWLSGVNPHGDERPVLLMVSQSHAGFLMPGLNADAARTSTDLPFRCWSDDDGPDAALTALLDDCGATAADLSVVLDETMRADFALRVLDAMDAPKRRFTDDTVGLLRAMKDTAEYDALKAAHLLNDAAVTEAFSRLEEGMSELDVQAILHTHYKAHGASAEFTIVGFGANSAFPHHHTGDTKLTRDMAVLIDTGCRLNGYPSDMTRCGWFGTPEAEYEQVFEVVEAAVKAAVQAAKPGVRASEVDRAARETIAAAGYGPQFLHRTGHGLGIDVHEPPYITATSDIELRAGNVFSIEPGIYLKDRFGVRLEEIVILRETGAEILSEMPRDMQRR